MPSQSTRFQDVILFGTIFLAGLCSIIYELLVSTTSSYFLGDSVKQFSLVIGIYLAAMGLGSFLSKFIGAKLLESFVRIEIALGLVGGLSVPLLYWLFSRVSTTEYQIIMLGLTAVIGTLTGFEIPVLVRLLKKYYPLESNLAYVLSLDYVGALAATLLFPFLLLPFIGTFKTSLIFGFINVALGVFVYRILSKNLGTRRGISEIVGVAILLGFAILGFYSEKILAEWEENLYQHRMVYAEQTPYQKLVLTRNGEDLRLYINRVIQFSSLDEYRYHEALALVPLNLVPHPKKVLILGGGEGLLAREVLRDKRVEQVIIVDLDEAVFRLGRTNPYLRELNRGALDDPRVTTIATDAMSFLQEEAQLYDLILADLPDPSNDALVRLYSTAFYKLAKNRLSATGILATQSTGTFHTPLAFWSIHETLRAAGFENVYPYHAYVPSFGDWGFQIAASRPLDPSSYRLPVEGRFITKASVPGLFEFPPDLAQPPGTEANRLDRPVLLDYFLEGFERWKISTSN